MSDSSNGSFELFCCTFTASIVAWNNAEASARRILSYLCKGGMPVEIAFLHLGNVALRDAILTVLDTFFSKSSEASAAAIGHVAHFVEGMDVLRGYRNFYAHSLMAIGRETDKEDDPTVGLLFAEEARGRYAWIQQDLTIEELRAFCEHAHALQNYGDDLALYLKAFGKGEPLDPKAKPLTSLQKPIWPERLSKNRDYLADRQPPHES